MKKVPSGWVGCGDRRLAGAALDAGADTGLVAEWINQAQSEKTAAQQDLLATTRTRTKILTAEQIQQMVTHLGSVEDRLLAAASERKQPVYESRGTRADLRDEEEGCDR